MVSEHNLSLVYGYHPFSYLENKKKEKEIKMMEGMSFISSLFRSMRDLTKEVKKRRMEPIRGILRSKMGLLRKMYNQNSLYENQSHFMG